MDTRRILEMTGAFLLGGGFVAVGYELGRTGAAGAASTGEDPADGAVGDQVGVPAGAPGVPGGVEAGTEGEGSPEGGNPGSNRPAYLQRTEEGTPRGFPDIYAAAVPFDAEAEAAYPQHGVVKSLAVVVRSAADLDSPMQGILRAGTRFRADAERTFGGSCKNGWNRIHPSGWICRDAGVAIAEEPPQDGIYSVPDPKLDAELPYEYWRVKDEMTPFFHRLPSFEEQDRADAAGRAWYDAHGREPMPTHPDERPKDVPAVVKEYMNAGYYVTKAGEEVKSKRRFARTHRGTYVRKYQLHQREPSDFRGRIVYSADELPIYFIRRELQLLQREGETSDVLVETGEIPPRLGTHPFARRLHIGNKEYFEDEEGKLMRSYGVGEAYKLKRAPGIGSEETWLHVDLSEQTLVAYIGDEPVFATLVSTGKEPGMTPVGVHRVQSKHIATSMRDQPPEDEAYSIEDVPWTQYFSNSIALHGAFWHGGFGLVRSHGCVNLSPGDARWLFGFTTPAVPAGWHSVFASVGDSGEGSAVVVTE